MINSTNVSSQGFHKEARSLASDNSYHRDSANRPLGRCHQGLLLIVELAREFSGFQRLIDPLVELAQLQLHRPDLATDQFPRIEQCLDFRTTRARQARKRFRKRSLFFSMTSAPRPKIYARIPFPPHPGREFRFHQCKSSLGTFPPLSATFCITCLRNQMFIAAVSFQSPL